MRHSFFIQCAIAGACFGFLANGRGGSNVYLTDVPDYDWWAGCFGTASGNLMGYWDRHGFPDFYTGPTNDGLAPLDSSASNSGIVSMWASQAGVDGRPSNQPGHYDDYWVLYQSTDADPFTTAGRPEHSPDCIGDFIGLSQWKWTNMDGECDGNLDGFSFNYWDKTGEKRFNYTPGSDAGLPERDIQSGLRSWVRYRGSKSETFSQLVDFNPSIPSGKGFTFNDLKAEINAGYPVLLFLQNDDEIWRNIYPLSRVNPELHGMLAYGYYETDSGAQYVRYRTSWASGDNRLHNWDSTWWEAGLEVRGVIGFHPTPRIRHCTLSDNNLTLEWEWPSSEIYDAGQDQKRIAQSCVIEMSQSLMEPHFSPITADLISNTYTITNSPSPAFYRIKVSVP